MFKPDDADKVQDDIAEPPHNTPWLVDRLRMVRWGTWTAIVGGAATVVTLIGFGMQLNDDNVAATADSPTTLSPTTGVAPPATERDAPSSTTSNTTTTPATSQPRGGPSVQDDELLTLRAEDGAPTQATTLETGALVQAELVEGSTAQPPAVSNLYVHVLGPEQQECQWAAAQRNEAGILGMDADPSRYFLFVLEAIRDDEIDVRVYDIRGELDIDEEPDGQGCRRLGVLGLDTPVPEWLGSASSSSLTELATANDGARFDEVLEAATDACEAYGEADHGATIGIVGFEHEVVWAATHADQRDRDQNERGGYLAAVTGDGPFLIIGSDEGDDLTSHTASDVICGNGGDDVITGKEGDDLIIGGSGSDRLRATSGLNILVGDDDDSELTGGADIDWCSDVENAFEACERRF